MFKPFPRDKWRRFLFNSTQRTKTTFTLQSDSDWVLCPMPLFSCYTGHIIDDCFHAIFVKMNFKDPTDSDRYRCFFWTHSLTWKNIYILVSLKIFIVVQLKKRKLTCTCILICCRFNQRWCPRWRCFRRAVWEAWQFLGTCCSASEIWRRRSYCISQGERGIR